MAMIKRRPAAHRPPADMTLSGFASALGLVTAALLWWEDLGQPDVAYLGRRWWIPAWIGLTGLAYLLALVSRNRMPGPEAVDKPVKRERRDLKRETVEDLPDASNNKPTPWVSIGGEQQPLIVPDPDDDPTNEILL